MHDLSISRFEKSWFLRSAVTEKQSCTTWSVAAVFQISHIIDFFDAEADIVGMLPAAMI